MDLPISSVVTCAFTVECKIITSDDKTEFIFGKESYEVPFYFPIKVENDLLFGKESYYIITQLWQSELKKIEVHFWLCYIELYQKEFEKKMEEFKKFVSLLEGFDSLKDVIMKIFLDILDISIKSYNKAYNYLYSSPYSGFQGSFRQYCGLDKM